MQLQLHQYIDIVRFFVEGNGIRGVSRMAGVSKDTVTKVLKRVGRAYQFFHDQKVRNLAVGELLFDEQWGFCFCKQKTVPIAPVGIHGDIWMWIAQCHQSRFVISHLMTPDRGVGAAAQILADAAARIRPNPNLRIITDCHPAYLAALDKVFPNGVNYSRTRQPLPPPELAGALIKDLVDCPPVVMGGTNRLERFNATVRHFNPGQRRKAYTFPRKFENMNDLMWVTIGYYNFCWPVRTMGVTPAMAIGADKRIWEISDLVDLMLKFELLWNRQKEDNSQDRLILGKAKIRD